MFRFSQCPRCCARNGGRWSSTSSEGAPPLLAKIRNDLKAAMRAKDTARLNVLRAIITETSNASKGNSPIKTDIQVLSMLRKRTAASKTAAHEFAEAKRDDLKQKQEAEIAVLDEYAGQVETVSDEEITQAIDEVFNPVDGSGSKPNSGLIMKELLKPGGRLQGKAVDKTRVAEMIKKKLS